MLKSRLNNMEDVLAADREARRLAREQIAQRQN
jgi:hypothetical protein